MYVYILTAPSVPTYIIHCITMFAQEKQTPLHIAAGKGLVPIVEALIGSKADLNAVEIVRWFHVCAIHFVNVSSCLLTCIFTYIYIHINVHTAQLDSITFCCSKSSHFSDKSINQIWSGCQCCGQSESLQ